MMHESTKLKLSENKSKEKKQIEGSKKKEWNT